MQIDDWCEKTLKIMKENWMKINHPKRKLVKRDSTQLPNSLLFLLLLYRDWDFQSSPADLDIHLLLSPLYCFKTSILSWGWLGPIFLVFWASSMPNEVNGSSWFSEPHKLGPWSMYGGFGIGFLSCLFICAWICVSSFFSSLIPPAIFIRYRVTSLDCS